MANFTLDSLDPETTSQNVAARMWFVGTILSSFAYGIHLTLCFSCMTLLLKTRGPRKLSLISYIISLFVLGTLMIISNARSAVTMLIDGRRDLSALNGPVESIFSVPQNLLTNVSFTSLNWIVGTMMLWRCYIIWRDRKILVLLVPLSSASLAIGIAFLIRLSQPVSNVWTETNVAFALPYHIIVLSIDAMATFLISIRILRVRHLIRNLLQDVSQYTWIVAMLIESSALYVLFSLLFLIPFGLHHPMQNLFIQMLGQVQIIGQLLIICRVAGNRTVTESLATYQAQNGDLNFCRETVPERSASTLCDGKPGLRITVTQETTSDAKVIVGTKDEPDALLNGIYYKSYAGDPRGV
ncbi:hypothetical protein OE88DRAFT_1701456 [Heliocybe sulcata]|uniref:Integral membrane protein n=1 Tax=Heliocybe sulcata TaxID=5364 RepID=A0A5C3NA00_9AGAM|nr:hypothetical protein OE88DRAFT_1701456 [Heliocybe sulcata]